MIESTVTGPVRGLLSLIGVAGLLGVAGWMSAACNGQGGEFYIVQNQVAGAGCVIPATKGALYQGEGILDIRITSGADASYLMFPLMQNDLLAEGGGGTEPNRISLRGFEVDLRFVDGPGATGDFFAGLAADPATGALVRYQSAWSGSIAPGGGTAAASVSAFPAETARRLRETGMLADGSVVRVNVLVRAFGEKLGASIKSDLFSYPLRICDGCLINRVTACPASGEVLMGSACNPGQDRPVDCCTEGADLICPATTVP